ncbi:MAG: hypothetical protein Q7U12_16845 [Undibacterium sp.]|nr:hypothetical protein [Undibacterium sp.]MDO9194567.1 hypothetical protein [Undibacterium sp.]
MYRALQSFTIGLPESDSFAIFNVQTRRPLVSLFLVFLLLFMQQVGYAHAISHLSNANFSNVKNSHLPAELACEQCIAFAQVGSAVRTDPITLAVTPVAVDIPLSRSTQFHFLKTVCVFHSRAPPIIA